MQPQAISPSRVSELPAPPTTPVNGGPATTLDATLETQGDRKLIINYYVYMLHVLHTFF